MTNETIIADIDEQRNDTDSIIICLSELNEALDKARAEGLFGGVVVALDSIAGYDDTLFKEIVQTAGKEEVLKEIKANGLDKTKEAVKRIFGM